jgi:polyisoprenoid-binding protein YceI
MALQKWNIDNAHSGVHFTARHMMFAKVRGRFTRWTGTLEVDEENPAASRVSADIEAASVDTNEEKRDGHLRSADFFDVDKYPKITFRSTKVEPKGPSVSRLIGDLTIRGVTRPVTVAVELLGKGKDPWGNERIVFSGSTSVDRKDFGLMWNQVLEAGGVLVGDKIEINLEIEAVKA